jgi:hypothetical protein
LATANLPCIQGSDGEFCPYSGDIGDQFSANLDSSDNKCIPSLTAALRYLNPSKRNLSTTTESPTDSEEAAAPGYHFIDCTRTGPAFHPLQAASVNAVDCESRWKSLQPLFFFYNAHRSP